MTVDLRLLNRGPHVRVSCYGMKKVGLEPKEIPEDLIDQNLDSALDNNELTIPLAWIRKRVPGLLCQTKQERLAKRREYEIKNKERIRIRIKAWKKRWQLKSNKEKLQGLIKEVNNA